jgi:hypothetical protein
MKIKIQLWALSYASIDFDDELYTETIGLYESKDDAFKAMKDNISSDIKDGDIEDNWKINGNTADYVDDFSMTRKSYRINSL